MNNDKLKALQERIKKLEHALLVAVTWHNGQANYVRGILSTKDQDLSEREAENDDVQS